jgi:hypothetical protein
MFDGTNYYLTGGNTVSTSSLTGPVTISAGTGVSLTVNGVANSYATQINGASTSGQSLGLYVQAGTTNADAAVLIKNQSGSTVFCKIAGDGSGDLGPSASLGLSWTASGGYTISAPSSGAGLTVNGLTNNNALSIVGSSTAGQSYGIGILAGSTSADSALKLGNQAGTLQFFNAAGDGGVTIGNAATTDEGAGTLNVQNGIYINGVSISPGTTSSGTFTGTLTGYASNPTGTVHYVVSGGMCSLYITSVGGITGTSNATTLGMTGLPGACNPANQQTVMCTNVTDNGNTGLVAGVSIGSSALNFLLAKTNLVTNEVDCGSSQFTASGTKGLGQYWTITYPIL